MQNSDSLEDAPLEARRRALFRYAAIGGLVAILIWGVWWTVSIYRLELLWGKHTWLRMPLFGADFISQSDLAARLTADGHDPYASRQYLFHYPPLVIWLFSWTPLLETGTALRIWVVVCIVLIVIGTFAALKVRRRSRIEQLPTSFAMAAVLFSFPVVFQLERANFDLITLAAMLLAFPLFNRRTLTAEFLAGCLLAAGPWVKLYPGIMGLGLLALRRWRASAGFVLAGTAIGLAAPTATLASFETLGIAIERMKEALYEPYYVWSHSLSLAFMKVLHLAAETPFDRLASWNVASVAAALTVSGIAGWVCWRVYRLPGCEDLLYPLLLWLNAVGSCFGLIANDYSLVFLPLAVIAVLSFEDPWFVRISMALLLPWWQPFGFPIAGLALLVVKMFGLVAVGVCLIRRARELSAGAAQPPRSPNTSGAAATPQAA